VRQVFLRLVDFVGGGSNPVVWRPERRRALLAMLAGNPTHHLMRRETARGNDHSSV
jgi:hypothetical protein